jgi:hypothetical protein
VAHGRGVAHGAPPLEFVAVAVEEHIQCHQSMRFCSIVKAGLDRDS